MKRPELDHLKTFTKADCEAMDRSELINYLLGWQEAAHKAIEIIRLYEEMEGHLEKLGISRPDIYTMNKNRPEKPEKQIVEETARFMSQYLDVMENRAAQFRENKDAEDSVPHAGIFWVEPAAYCPQNDTWKFAHVSKTPVTLADKSGNRYTAKADHRQVWESLKPHGIVKGEYTDTPHGTIFRDTDTWIAAVGNFAFEDTSYTKVKHNLKTMIAKEFALPENTRYTHDSRYDIPTMSPQEKSPAQEALARRCGGQPWQQDIERVFEDFVTPSRNFMDADPVDLENFLATEGNLGYECITQPRSAGYDRITALLASGKFKTVKKILACVYCHTDMTVNELDTIIGGIRASIPEETEMLAGWIRDEQTGKDSVTVHLAVMYLE